MAEIINTNVFDANKKFVDLTGLDHFWDKAKTYIDGIDTEIKGNLTTVSGKVTTLEGVVGDANNGLVKEVNALRSEVNALGGVEGGIAGMIDTAITGLGAATVAEGDNFVTGVSVVDGKLQVTSGKCHDYSGEIAQTLTDAKKYTNDREVEIDKKWAAADATLKSDLEKYADQAESDAIDAAKSYTDGREVEIKKYADQAELDAIAAAKSYTDGKDSAMDTRVKVLEAIDHEKLASDASAAAVATILDGAPEKFDTLKEVADWIASSESADSAADLVTRVNRLETNKDTEGNPIYDVAGAAATAESNAKSYADGLVMDGETPRFDSKGSAAQALVDAKAYTDGKVDGKFDGIGSAATAKTEAIAEAARLDGELETRVKSYADGLVMDGETPRFDSKGSAAQALVDANTNAQGYANTAESNAKTAAQGYANTAKTEAVSEAKAYADGLVMNGETPRFDSYGSAEAAKQAAIQAAVAQAAADAAETLKGYYTKKEVDNLLAENSTVDQTYAKTYTDQLFNSFKFASTTDIDGLFN